MGRYKVWRVQNSYWDLNQSNDFKIFTFASNFSWHFLLHSASLCKTLKCYFYCCVRSLNTIHKQQFCVHNGFDQPKTLTWNSLSKNQMRPILWKAHKSISIPAPVKHLPDIDTTNKLSAPMFPNDGIWSGENFICWLYIKDTVCFTKTQPNSIVIL